MKFYSKNDKFIKTMWIVVLNSKKSFKEKLKNF